MQGEEADARSDIFGLGCVLYEMVAGQRAFEGKSQLGVLTAILEKEPQPISAVDPSVPVRLDQLIAACLAKDPSERFQSAHDVATELRWIASSTTAVKQDEGLKKSWALYGAVASLLLILLAGLGGYWWSARNTAVPPSFHAEISPPEKSPFTATGDFGGMPVLSPQGDKIAFVAGSANSNQMLWVRVLSSDSAQPLDGTQNAAHPFWSPDGRSIGFFANKKLNTIPASGGQITVIADAINSRGGTWGADNIIVFSPDFRSPLLKVSAQGGPTSPATVLDQTKHTTHRWPWFLPDGKHFIYLATNHLGGVRQETSGIYFASVDNPQARMLVTTDAAGQYSSGYLLFRANNALVAQPFDPESGKLSGSPAPVVSNVRFDSGVWRGIFAVSQNGVLIYQAGNNATSGTQLTWFDRSGKILGQVGDREGLMYDVHISPDGKRVAFAAGNPFPSLWTIDLQRGTKTRITFDQEAISLPSWSPDGQRILFHAGSPNGGLGVIRSKNSDGTGEEEVLAGTPHPFYYPAWTPDEKYITYVMTDGYEPRSLWRQSVVPNSQPEIILRPPSAQSNLYQAAVSPDGHWVAYVSDESGENNLYITSFPDAKGKWRVSDNGGSYPVWNKNGKEIFFKSLTDDYFSAAVSIKGNVVEAGTPKHLFHAAVPAIGMAFDVAPDGQRLLVNLSQSESTAPLIIVSNWTAELKK